MDIIVSFIILCLVVWIIKNIRLKKCKNCNKCFIKKSK